MRSKLLASLTKGLQAAARGSLIVPATDGGTFSSHPVSLNLFPPPFSDELPSEVMSFFHTLLANSSLAGIRRVWPLDQKGLGCVALGQGGQPDGALWGKAVPEIEPGGLCAPLTLYRFISCKVREMSLEKSSRGWW